MSLEDMFPDARVRSLAEASGDGNIKAINKLIGQGINVNASGSRGATPLFWAMGNVKGFNRLLELGADPNVIYDDGTAIMHWVVNHDDEMFLKLALKHGGNPNLIAGINGETPLFEAVGPNNKNKLSILLDAGADMNFQAKNGETPMMVAAGLGQFDVVFELLERGANYQLRSHYTGKTLMDRISSRKETMDPNNELSRWMERVVDWLEFRGVKIS